MSIEEDNSKDLVSYATHLRGCKILKCLNKLGLKRGERVLNIQYGGSILVGSLLQLGFVVHVVRKTQHAVELTKQACEEHINNTNIIFSVGVAEQLDSADDLFDVAIVVDEIEHLKWDRWALQETHRVIKPGGYLILSVPGGIVSTCCIETADSKRESIKLYKPVSLKRMLKSLDFEILGACGSSGWRLWAIRLFDGLSRKLGKLCQRVLQALFSKITTDYIIVCRKPKSPERIDEKTIFMNIEDNINLFQSKHSEMFKRRNAWLEKNPQYHNKALKELDISSFAGENVLVISPHPDDEIIGCGGTLIRLLEVGASVAVIQMTDGSASSALEAYPEDLRKTIRIQESEDVAESLGFSELILWKEKDNRLECTPINTERLKAVLDSFQPKLIFVPFFNDSHKDHVAANMILAESLKAANLDLNSTSILSYEVWSLVPPNCYCMIDDQFKKKTQMLMKYRTGMKVIDYVHFCELLNSYEAYTFLIRKGFAETFLSLDSQAYLRLGPVAE